MVQSNGKHYQRGFLLIDDTPDGYKVLVDMLSSTESKTGICRIDHSIHEYLPAARQSWTDLQRECTFCTIIGSGAGCIPALLIAELYTAELLILLDFPHRPMTDSGRYTRLVCRNLFLLTAPLLIVRSDKHPPFLPRSVLKAVDSSFELANWSDSRLSDLILYQLDRFTAPAQKK